MSGLRRNHLTPTGAKVRQAFKSPLRTVQDASDESGQKASPLSSRTPNSVVRPHHVTTSSSLITESTRPGDKVTPSTPMSSPLARTPGHHRSLLARKNFKPPFSSPNSSKTSVSSAELLVTLQSQEEQLDKEIEELEMEGYTLEELQEHIERLHRYNEIKDATQLVLGRLAEMEQLTLKEMHEKYLLPVGE